MENNQYRHQNPNLSKIQYPRTLGDVKAELNVAKDDPSLHFELGDLMVVDQTQAEDCELSLDVRPKFVRKPGDEHAEKLVEWSENNSKFKAEARMRIEALYGLKQGDSGEPEAYTKELKSLQDNFGTPKPVIPVESPSLY